MINLKANRISNTKKNTISEENPLTFRPTRENRYYLNKNCNTSEFINKALNFYINLINNPKFVMLTLKKQNPELWKYVNRKQFI